MSHGILNYSVFEPYQAGQFLQIDSGSLTVVNEKEKQDLPKLLKKLPYIIQQFAKDASVSFEHRLCFHGRIAQLKTEATSYNKEIDDSFWITLLHVILLIITFGGFDYKATWKLEEPRAFLADLLPDSFSPKGFLESYTAGQFRALGEEVRSELTSLLKIDADAIQTFMIGAEKKTLAELLFTKTPSSSGISTPTSFSSSDAEEFDLALILASNEPLQEELIQSLNAEFLVEQLGLTTLTKQDFFEGKELPPNCANLKKLLPILTQNQWEELPEALFFLFVLHGFQEKIYSFDELGYDPFRTLYTARDPDLTELPKLLQNMEIEPKAALIIRLFDEQSKDGQRTPSPIATNIPNLSSRTIAELIMMLLLFESAKSDNNCQTAFSVLRLNLINFIPLTQLPNLPTAALSQLYQNAEEGSELKQAAKTQLSMRTSSN